MVMKLHENGIRVIMDVVYNHTYTAYDSCFTCTFPNYYYRVKDNVNTNGSGCGNETASDHIMYRKYMIDSVLYWAKEYHVDGFRFDLLSDLFDPEPQLLCQCCFNIDHFCVFLFIVFIFAAPPRHKVMPPRHRQDNARLRAAATDRA